MTKRTIGSADEMRSGLARNRRGAAGVAKPGVIRMAFAQDKTPIKIGFPVPLSGIYGDYAKDQVNGAQLAISQFNAKGGVLGRKVELLVRDDQLDVQVNIRWPRNSVKTTRSTSFRGRLAKAPSCQ